MRCPFLDPQLQHSGGDKRPLRQLPGNSPAGPWARDRRRLDGESPHVPSGTGSDRVAERSRKGGVPIWIRGPGYKRAARWHHRGVAVWCFSLRGCCFVGDAEKQGRAARCPFTLLGAAGAAAAGARHGVAAVWSR